MTTDIPLLDNFFDARIRRILFSKISFLVLWYFLVQVTNYQKFRVTMAAIDPSAAPQLDSHPEGAAPRATLKLVREPIDDDDESDEDYDDVDAIRARLSGAISDEEDEDEESEEDDEDSDEEKNGGPSDPARTKKARKEAAMREIKKLLEEEEEMDLDNTPNGVNGIKANKGKGKATDLDEDSSEDEDLEGEMEEFVICTLDPEKVQIRPLSSRLNPHLFTNFFSELSATS